MGPQGGGSPGEGNSNPHQNSCLTKAQRPLGVYSPWGCKVLTFTDPHAARRTHTHTQIHTWRCLSPSSLLHSLPPSALTSPPHPSPINSCWGISSPTLSPHWEAPWQTRGSSHQCLITERSNLGSHAGNPCPQAPTPWPHQRCSPMATRGARNFPGGGNHDTEGAGGSPPWSPGWGDGRGRLKLLLAPVPALG